MAASPLHRASRELNLLTSYVKYLSRGVTIRVATDGPAAQAIERGKQTFTRRAGPLNFSCSACHVASAGHWLRGQRLRSLDETAGDWPKHFIAEHDLGLISVLALGSQEYTGLELYLTARANGTPIWAPTNSRLRGE